MKTLTYAETNAMNFIILEDAEREAFRVVDWDLSDEEITALVEKFKAGSLEESDFNSDEWQTGELSEYDYFGINPLAYM